MKKFLSVLALLVAVVAVSFAGSVATMYSETINIDLREGRNVVRLRDGSSLTFTAREGDISTIELRRATGLVIKFDDDACSTCATPPPAPCNGDVRCSYSQKYKAYICFCVPNLDLTSGGNASSTAVQVTKLAKSTRCVIRID